MRTVTWDSAGSAVAYVLRQMLFCESLGFLPYRATAIADTRRVVQQSETS